MKVEIMCDSLQRNRTERKQGENKIHFDFMASSKFD